MPGLEPLLVFKVKPMKKGCKDENEGRPRINMSLSSLEADCSKKAKCKKFQ